MKKEIALILLAVFAFSCSSANKEASSAEKESPNVIYIHIDDLGYKDLGFMGSSYYETPNIDTLAKSGMIFTQGYAGAANCAPSRACLMTGQNTPRHKIYTVSSSERGNAKSRRIIPIRNTLHIKNEHYSLAELFKDAGYQTGTFGKWHISEDPLRDGFDYNIGGTKAGSPGKEGYFAPYNNLPGLTIAEEEEYLTDRLTNEAIKFLEERRNEKFLLYLPYFAVHTPLMGKDALIKKYKAKAAQNGQGHAVYAAMVENLDTQIGRLLAKVKELQLREKTLIIFTSDNGGIRAISTQAPLRAGKGSYYEGGIRVPYIFSWPGEIEKGSTCETPIVNLDIFPTLAKVLQKDVSHLELDGQNIMSLLKGGKIEDRNFFWHFPIYLQAYDPQKDDGRDPLFRTRPGSVIRKGDWKLHEYYEDGGIELYNLAEDVGERKNLLNEVPQKAEELLALLRNWQKEIGADIPTELNPAFEEGFVPKKYR